MLGCVYVATNRINGKLYVGKSVKGLLARRKEHFREVENGKRSAFYSAIRKYGLDAFTWEIVYMSDCDEALCVAEVAIIADFRRDGPTYNQTDGGQGLAGLRRTPEHNAKISAAHMGRKRQLTPEQREARYGPQRGRKLSAEHRAKISAAGKGRVLSPEHIEKTRKAHLGATRSDETRARISASLRGRPVKLETREKLRVFNTGKKRSHDAIERTRKAHLGAKRTEITRQRIRDDQARRRAAKLALAP